MAHWKKIMEDAYQIASRTANKGAAQGKAHYDKKVGDLHPGDRVLIGNLTPRGGTGKIRSYWEDQVYRVKERKGDNNPVYEVSPESGKGRNRVIHRNLLLPCDHLPLERPVDLTHLPKNRCIAPPKNKTGPERGQRIDLI